MNAVTYSNPAPADAPPAPLYIHDGGEVECVADTYTVGHSSTLFYSAQADPNATLLFTERGTWERVTAATLTEWAAMSANNPNPPALTCEVCGREPLT